MSFYLFVMALRAIIEAAFRDLIKSKINLVQKNTAVTNRRYIRLLESGNGYLHIHCRPYFSRTMMMLLSLFGRDMELGRRPAQCRIDCRKEINFVRFVRERTFLGHMKTEKITYEKKVAAKLNMIAAELAKFSDSIAKANPEDKDQLESQHKRLVEQTKSIQLRLGEIKIADSQTFEAIRLSTNEALDHLEAEVTEAVEACHR